MADDQALIRTYGPGDASYVSYLHMKYYREHHCFKPIFEYYVMKGLSEFLNDPKGSDLWLAETNGLVVGSIAIVKTPHAAQLRWFLVDAEHQGKGLGRNLMNTAMYFCEEQKYGRVFLWTVNTLKVARRLYKEFGFVLAEEKPNDEWTDDTIIEERWEMNSLNPRHCRGTSAIML